MSRYTNGNGMNGSAMGYQPRVQRDHEPLSKTNVFIRGLSATTNDDDLFNMCSKYGTIVSSKSITDRLTNECKGYGFVNFENPSDAATAVRELTNCGYQARMSKENMGRSERSSFGRRSPTEFRRSGAGNGGGGVPNGLVNNRYNNNGGGSGGPGSVGGGSGNMRQYSKTNLYLRGLDVSTSDNDLHVLCERYGNILSAKAIVNRATNECKGYGFVNFDSPYAAEQAVMDLASRGYQVQMSRENRPPRQPILAGAPTWQ